MNTRVLYMSGRRRALVTTVVLLFVLSLAACGSDEKTSGSGTATEAATEAATGAASASSEGQVIKLVIEGNDLMQFNLSELRVPAGSTVELTLKHVGKQTREIMGHNLVILNQGVDPMEFGMAAAQDKENDYLPPSLKDQVLVHTKLIGGGEEDTITFQAPAAGTYDFLCSFPGHFAMMKGKFIVE